MTSPKNSLKSYGSKEEYHTYFPQGIIKGKFCNSGTVTDTGENRKEQTADYGCRNTEFFQKMYFLS